MKPQPITVATVCSLCDQPWEDHGDKPSKDDCIRLLKAALALRPVQQWWTINSPNAYPQYSYTATDSTFIPCNVTSINRDDPPDMGVTANVG